MPSFWPATSRKPHRWLSERAVAPRNTVAGDVEIMSRDARAEYIVWTAEWRVWTAPKKTVKKSKIFKIYNRTVAQKIKSEAMQCVGKTIIA